MTAESSQHAGRRIARTRELRGLACPAIIHNANYYFVNLRVYEDGIVDCWEMVDLALFEGKVRSGWVETRVPDGERISIHGLGAWSVEAGSWDHSPGGFVEHVTGLVRELNPTMENLHDCEGTTTRTVGRVRVSKMSMGRPRPTRPEDPTSVLPRSVDGSSLSVFLRCGNEIFLADLRVFANDTVELGRLPTVEVLPLAQLEQLAANGRLMTAPPTGARIHIHGLGAFTLGAMQYATDLQDLLLEAQDEATKLRGDPGSVERCRLAFEDYCKDPTEAGIERLRLAYEAVPAHNRMYVGDMDTKDVPIRMVIYGDQEIERWSHRAVAASRGERLPTITVPKPESDSD
jgi:hypothetical protein